MTTFDGVIIATTMADMDPLEVHALCMLRVDIFVVEQAQTWRELDEADADPATVHLRAYDGDRLVGVARMLPDGDATRIGRVCVARSARRRGVGAALIEEAMGLADAPVILDAQSHLAGWYATFGFRPTGEDFDEEGVPHTPMRLG